MTIWGRVSVTYITDKGLISTKQNVCIKQQLKGNTIEKQTQNGNRQKIKTATNLTSNQRTKSYQ